MATTSVKVSAQVAPAKEVVGTLNDLIQLDYDAILAYSQALENIDIPDIYNELDNFRKDHESHIQDLSGEIKKLGAEPIEQKRDVKGFFIENFTSIRSKTGTMGALKAMKMNEELTNSRYEASMKSSLPESAQVVVRKNYADEVRHLKYICDKIDNNAWEVAAANPHPSIH